MKNNRAMFSWSDLPEEILRQIAKHLDVGEEDNNDVLHFRGVCSSWRRSTRTSMSQLLPYFIEDNSMVFSSSVFLIRSSCLGSDTTPSIICCVKNNQGRLQFYHPVLGTPFPPFQHNFNLSHIKPIIEPCYYLDVCNDCGTENALDISLAGKTIMFSSKYFPSFVDCSQIVLCNGGLLAGYPKQSDTEEDVEWERLSGDCFDDIIEYSGIVVALDADGKLHKVDGNGFVLHDNLVVDTPLCEHCSSTEFRRRLVVSRSKLYLVRKMRHTFRVYELSRDDDGYKWVEVYDFGNQVLFVSKHHGFFVEASEFASCQLDNCIIFSADAFPPKSKKGWIKNIDCEKGPMIYRLRKNWVFGDGFKLLSSYPGFPANVWSPPPQWGPREENLMPRSATSFGPESRVGTTIISTSAAQEQPTGIPSVNLKASHLETAKEKNICIETTHSVVDQSNKSDNSTVKFGGFDIRSSLLPILQDVWSKHGNLVENCMIKNSDIIARALELLATAIVILEENSARILSDTQADYLRCTLSDLRCMQFKVDWLVPQVEKAVGKRKMLMDQLDQLGRHKAQVAERTSKLHAELAALGKLGDKLEEDMAKMSKLIHLPENVDLDKSSGGGLS